MLTPWYRRLFPATRLDRQAVHHLATTQGGKRYATSVGGTLTGMGADIIIADDPIKPDEALSDAERKKVNEWLGPCRWATARAATTDEVRDLRREASALKECVADLTLENRLLKKSMIADEGDHE